MLRFSSIIHRQKLKCISSQTCSHKSVVQSAVKMISGCQFSLIKVRSEGTVWALRNVHHSAECSDYCYREHGVHTAQRNYTTVWWDMVLQDSDNLMNVLRWIPKLQSLYHVTEWQAATGQFDHLILQMCAFVDTGLPFVCLLKTQVRSLSVSESYLKHVEGNGVYKSENGHPVWHMKIHKGC